jgi:hypothetical protein
MNDINDLFEQVRSTYRACYSGEPGAEEKHYGTLTSLWNRVYDYCEAQDCLDKFYDLEDELAKVV